MDEGNMDHESEDDRKKTPEERNERRKEGPESGEKET